MTYPNHGEEKVALYCGYLTKIKGVQSCTLKTYISAIKAVLIEDGYDWSQEKAALSSLIKSCKMKNDRLKNHLPIWRSLLELMMFQLEKYFRKRNQLYLKFLYKTAFILAYYGLLRVGEITHGNHTIKAKDVHKSNDRNKLMLILYSSKTHSRANRPQKIRINRVRNPTRGFSRFFFPVTVALDYIDLRGGRLNEHEEFLIFSDRRPLKPDQLRKVMRTMIKALGLDPALYDTHSFRIGRATDLLKNKVTIDQIKKLGR